jgi:hypothetical protein
MPACALAFFRIAGRALPAATQLSVDLDPHAGLLMRAGGTTLRCVPLLRLRRWAHSDLCANTIEYLAQYLIYAPKSGRPNSSNGRKDESRSELEREPGVNELYYLCVTVLAAAYASQA